MKEIKKSKPGCLEDGKDVEITPAGCLSDFECAEGLSWVVFSGSGMTDSVFLTVLDVVRMGPARSLVLGWRCDAPKTLGRDAIFRRRFVELVTRVEAGSLGSVAIAVSHSRGKALVSPVS